MRQGLALVISAPSGAGKSTLCAMLRAEFPDFGYSISCATRPMRSGEVDGKDYFFMSKTDFEKMRKAGEFAEWACVHGNFYGTPLAPVLSMLKNGQDALFDIDVQGAAQLKAKLPQAVFVFLLPPSLRELESRLRKRGFNDENSLRLRMENAVAEIRQAFWYDALIVNDDLDKAYARLRAAYVAAALAPKRDAGHLQKLLAEADNGRIDCGA